ncbi:MAG: N-acetyltransferase [Candidatus Aminicenantes bacterium]|nr:MAG: N-acetyltransferase [Candidatus Aminicenantes bacterium]
MMIIRPEKKKDYKAIQEINELAFGGRAEVVLIEALRKSDSFIPELCLVAVQKGEVIGHILFSPIVIKSKERVVSALALAPMAVHPKFQNKGVGSKLVYQGLEDCQRLGHKIIVVIGHPEYYPRFGFLPARAKGLDVAFPVPDEAFMVLELVPGSLDVTQGEIIYPPAFQEAS